MSVLGAAMRGFGHVVAAGIAGPRLSILIFHRVLARPDALLPGEPDAAFFEARMRFVKSAFNVIPLIDAARHLRERTLPANAACITFDDGYADNAVVALPILQRVGIPATFFVATGFLDGGRMWNDTVIEAVRAAPGPRMNLIAIGLGERPCATNEERVATIAGLLDALKYRPQPERSAKVAELATAVGLDAASDLMMTRSQVRALHDASMSIGAHTVTHPILTTLSEVEARREIDDGRRELEAIVGTQVALFAYPNGKPVRDYDQTHVALVRELGFDAAVSTGWGTSDGGSDLFQLPRFTPWDVDMNRFGLRLAMNLARRRADTV